MSDVSAHQLTVASEPILPNRAHFNGINVDVRAWLLSGLQSIHFTSTSVLMTVLIHLQKFVLQFAL